MDLSSVIKTVVLSNPVLPQGRRIGIEVECLFYDQQFYRIPVNRGSKFSATDLMEALVDPGKPYSYSLEPGGQVEWASAPVLNLHRLSEQFLEHLNNETALIKEHQLCRLDLSMEPLYQPEEIELIDQEKYRLMHALFKKTGTLGQWMMRNTASIQVNLDIVSEQDGEEMAFLADVFQPFCSLLFANSPFKEGLPTGKRNFRYEVWANTDKDRCGYLFDHGIVSAKGLLDQYCEWLLTIPAIFRVDDGTFSAFQGTLGAYLNSLPKVDNQAVLSALHQIFTHVRFKKVLEVRGSDRPPAGFELAPAAFWVGLLTGEKTRNKALDFAKSISAEERVQLNNLAFTLDLSAKGPRERSLRTWLEQVVDLALTGLEERSQLLGIKNERIFLDSYLEEFFKNGFMSIQVQSAHSRRGIPLIAYLRSRCEKTLNRY
ncbi:MAG: glutamate-cysteine ligase family protein [Fidelibacterota bacterium]